MHNNYEYIDPDYTYSDPKTCVMRNLANITNPDDLLFFESTAVVSITCIRSAKATAEPSGNFCEPSLLKKAIPLT